MKSMSSAHVSLVILLTFFGQLPAQTDPFVKITGMVYDNKRRPIKAAKVFLAYTAIGAKTRGSGIFKLTDVPPGSYDLMVFKEGYRLSQFPVTVDARRRNTFNFRLKPKPKSGAESARANQEKHQKNVERFSKAFFSTTPNSYECTILNPEVLQFPNDDGAIFKVVAEDPIIFENRALGYRVTYFLQEFEISINFTKYQGIPIFEELTPASGDEAHKWRLNRLKAYRGSPQHFFATLYENCSRGAENNAIIKEEGFIVSAMQDLRHEADEPYNLPTGYMTRSKQVDVLEYVTPGENESEFVLKFPGYWQITYTNERQAPEYLRHQGINPNFQRRYQRVNKTGLSDYRGEVYSGNLGDQVSLIKLTSGSLLLGPKTNYRNLTGVQVQDYWSWQGMAENIPREYTLAVARSEEAALARYLNEEY